MSGNDVKSWLYGWLGKKKLGVPVYSITETGRGRQRFRCEVRVPGQQYVGMGVSVNKKDAATNAARDFAQFLIRQNMLSASEVPQLDANSLEATADPAGWGPLCNGPLSGVNQKMKAEVVSDAGNNCEEGATSFPTSGSTESPYRAVDRVKTEHEKYISERAEEVAQSESVDLRADIHGGWTVENSKKALNEYLQKRRQPALTYETKAMGSDQSRTFTAEASVYIAEKRRTFTGRGQGSSKKVAEAQCAVSIVRQMYHTQIIPAFSGEKKKKGAANLEAIPVCVSGELVKKIGEYLSSIGINEVKEYESAQQNFPVSLLVSQKLDNFPSNESQMSGTIPWCPPIQNWNPWRAANIDEAPLAFMSLEAISEKLKSDMIPRSVSDAMRRQRESLPVYQFREQIISTVAKNSVTLIKGETGCGKSTQVCQYLMEDYIERDSGALFAGAVTQPRRISAITLAERVAEERGEDVGTSVGYGVRFNTICPRPYGSVMFFTVGVLLRKLESGLRGITHVIVDEIHERDINVS
ncbi:hypothetical protein AB6A40_008173 [Gnathostoma spinigerum]|uniref:RNA helicase n=1 Tax=Gnathostoma spinigerum TaxID=75299 RepID=A0ABD6ENA3_9BILA